MTDTLGPAIVAEFFFPAVTLWNRLEGRPRADRFDRALRAEARDALWYLTRQWQLGEFTGDDAGSPVFVKMHTTTTRLEKYQAGDHDAEGFDDAIPLETKVEARPVALQQSGRDISLDLRLVMGRHWLKLMASLGDFKAAFLREYPIHRPDPQAANQSDAMYCAHVKAWSSFAAVAGRRMDGGRLYLDLKDPVHNWNHLPELVGLEPQVDALADRFVAWFEDLIYQPQEGEAWVSDRLEYQFAVSAPEGAGEKVLVADEYYQGRLDWYSVDIDDQTAALGDPPTAVVPPTTNTQVLLPTPVSFDGMPNTRWWAFEDGRTNFGEVKPDTTDLASLLLIEFGLVYANDWFLTPHTLPAGSIQKIEGVAVTNVFGERTWIEAAGSGPDDAWQRWAMFNSSIKGTGRQAADTSLVMLPTAPRVQEGPVLEEVTLIRDEVANMVWGIETTIPLPSGEGKPGREAAREIRSFFEQDLERRLGAPPVPPPPAEEVEIRYQVMRSVPEHWIPFIPVHVPGDVRETQLQRAAMPRIMEGDTDAPRKVRPRTELLREGIGTSPYFLHEEEVPRAGAQITQRFQRTRWRDGRAWVWLGVRKQTSRGEGSSGLAFDIIPSVNPRA